MRVECGQCVVRAYVLKMCFLLRNELLECLTLLILLRLVNVPAPPLVRHLNSVSLECLDSLHEIFGGCGCDDDALRFIQDTLFQSHEHELVSALHALGPLRDSWKRFVRNHGVLPTKVQAAIICLGRRFGRLGFYSDIDALAVTSFHLSCIADSFSSLLSDLNALHENFAMNLEDVNCYLPIRKWGAKVLQPQAGVEVEMTLPEVSQPEFDLILTYWHFFEVATRTSCAYLFFFEQFGDIFFGRSHADMFSCLNFVFLELQDT